MPGSKNNKNNRGDKGEDLFSAFDKILSKRYSISQKIDIAFSNSSSNSSSSDNSNNNIHNKNIRQRQFYN